MKQTSFYLDEHIHRAVPAGLRHRALMVFGIAESIDSP